MKRATLFAVAAALFVTAFPAFAHADMYCPHQISIFGMVSDVHQRQFTLKSESRMGYIHVDFDPTRVDAHGLPMRSGTFAGVYGCLQPGGRSFSADQVTLAGSANDYTGYPRHMVSFDGRITSVASGRALLSSDDGHGDVWVYTSQSLRRGEHVHVTGTFDPTDSAFVASTVAVQP